MIVIVSKTVVRGADGGTKTNADRIANRADGEWFEFFHYFTSV
ncbi:MAG: hypothetical protein P4L76_07515 [Beijerinckiaceae bacterium]|nr:hypothetical protein [Beijerinckiaceae bacterium]